VSIHKFVIGWLQPVRKHFVEVNEKAHIGAHRLEAYGTFRGTRFETCVIFEDRQKLLAGE